jgi:hypothetical protein
VQWFWHIINVQLRAQLSANNQLIVSAQILWQALLAYLVQASLLAITQLMFRRSCQMERQLLLQFPQRLRRVVM